MTRCEIIDYDLIKVNGKEVRQDMNGNWIGQDLNAAETKHFQQFVASKHRIGKSLIAIEYK